MNPTKNTPKSGVFSCTEIKLKRDLHQHDALIQPYGYDAQLQPFYDDGLKWASHGNDDHASHGNDPRGSTSSSSCARPALRCPRGRLLLPYSLTSSRCSPRWGLVNPHRQWRSYGRKRFLSQAFFNLSCTSGC